LLHFAALFSTNFIEFFYKYKTYWLSILAGLQAADCFMADGTNENKFLKVAVLKLFFSIK